MIVFRTEYFTIQFLRNAFKRYKIEYYFMAQAIYLSVSLKSVVAQIIPFPISLQLYFQNILDIKLSFTLLFHEDILNMTGPAIN